MGRASHAGAAMIVPTVPLFAAGLHGGGQKPGGRRLGRQGNGVDGFRPQPVQSPGEPFDPHLQGVIGRQGQRRDRDSQRQGRNCRGDRRTPDATELAGSAPESGPAAGSAASARPTESSVPKSPKRGARAAILRSVPTLRRSRSVSTRCARATARSRSTAGRPHRRTAAKAIARRRAGIHLAVIERLAAVELSLIKPVQEPRGEIGGDNPPTPQPEGPLHQDNNAQRHAGGQPAPRASVQGRRTLVPRKCRSDNPKGLGLQHLKFTRRRPIGDVLVGFGLTLGQRLGRSFWSGPP